MIPILQPDPESPFPPVDQALDDPPGLLAAGGDLSPARLLNAYRNGIFPWYSEDQPILWWSPAPRCVLYPQRVHVSRRLRRRYNQGQLKLSTDRAFEQVIRACAAPRPGQDDTWITSGMIDAYTRLHRQGIAHSLEVWSEGKLAGGIYGLALGRVFFGESMFGAVADASKIALVSLCLHLRQCNFTVIDCQVSNPHLLSMGAEQISRQLFDKHLLETSGADNWKQDLNFKTRW
jgi:leucyl/phenylalanyl-tRNA--protein transferase